MCHPGFPAGHKNEPEIQESFLRGRDDLGTLLYLEGLEPVNCSWCLRVEVAYAELLHEAVEAGLSIDSCFPSQSLYKAYRI